MTDMVNGMSQSQDSSSSQPVPSPTPSAPAPAQSASDERTFRQSEVSDIVKRAKSDAVETYRRMQQEQPQYLQQKYGDASIPQPVQQQANSLPEDHIRRLAAEEAQRHIESIRKESMEKAGNEAAQRTVQNFWNKVLPGRDKYEDFDKVTSDIEFARFPNVVQLLGDYVDNSDDILYELGKDRVKMANLESLAERSPRDAIVQMKRLSESVKENVSATKMKLPNEPLSQLRPSNTGTDLGAMSVTDFRKKYRV